MDELLRKMTAQDEKLEAIWRSVEKTRKYFRWTLIITLLAIVLPLIGLLFVIPAFLGTLNFSSLGL